MANTERASPQEWVALGRIVRAQGLRGAVRVAPYGVAPEISGALLGKKLLLRSPKDAELTREVTVAFERWHKATWIVEFAECASRNDAETLVGWEVCLAEEDRPALGADEFYHDQLIGLKVVDERTGEALGEVVGVQPQPAADLLEVGRAGGGRFLLPLVKAMIRKVDLATGELRVDLPEGLIDVNG